jgi:tetratricopeptide (TPR) repeat protein
MAGQTDRYIEICTELADQPGTAHVLGLCGLLAALPAVGRIEKAMTIAEEALAAARAHNNPYWVAFALQGYSRVISQADPSRALSVMRDGLVYTREHRLPAFEAAIAIYAAGLEAVDGNLDEAVSLFDAAIDSFHRAGNVGQVAEALASLAVFLDRWSERPDVAATVYGSSTNHPRVGTIFEVPGTIEHLRSVLGDSAFNACAAAGSALDLSAAVDYARHQIQLIRRPDATS